MQDSMAEKMEEVLKMARELCRHTKNCCGCPAYQMTMDSEHCRLEAEKANPTQWDWLWED